MATTEMDYENANGDRFEGQFQLSSIFRLNSKPAVSSKLNLGHGNDKY